jgi:RNA polymerase sigma-70 factor (ECF subfamily)
MERVETLTQARAAMSRSEFDDKVRQHYRAVYNLAYKMCQDQDEAAELTQETFLKAYRALHTYRPELPFANWVYRILSNLRIDRYRRRPKLTVHSLDRGAENDEGELKYEVPDWRENPEQAALSAELSAAYQTALKELPEAFRQAVVMVDMEGLTYEETSEAMGTSIGTVRSRVFRGRQFLREKLGKYLRAES